MFDLLGIVKIQIDNTKILADNNFASNEQKTIKEAKIMTKDCKYLISAQFIKFNKTKIKIDLNIIVLTKESYVSCIFLITHQKVWPSHNERAIRRRSSRYPWKHDGSTISNNMHPLCDSAPLAVKRKDGCTFPPSTPAVGKTGLQQMITSTVSPKLAVASPEVRLVGSTGHRLKKFGRLRSQLKNPEPLPSQEVRHRSTVAEAQKAYVDIFLETLRSHVLAYQ